MVMLQNESVANTAIAVAVVAIIIALVGIVVTTASLVLLVRIGRKVDQQQRHNAKHTRAAASPPQSPRKRMHSAQPSQYAELTVTRLRQPQQYDDVEPAVR